MTNQAESLISNIARLMAADSTAINILPDEDGNERLVIGLEPVGRCFKLYGFMEQLSGLPYVLADFADVLVVIKDRYPDNFEKARAEVEGLAQYFEPEHRDEWLSFWRAV